MPRALQCSVVYNGMLHSLHPCVFCIVYSSLGKDKPRHRLFSLQTRARNARNLVGDSAPACLNGCSSGFDLCNRHTVASARVTCLRHSSNGRPI